MTDVDDRLASGAPAVAATAGYVAACAAVGYRYPGLDADLVRRGYRAEQGMRLKALDADIAALTRAAAAAEEALAAQRGGLDLLAEAWQGGSGSAAVEFVTEQCASAAGVVAALRDAADILAGLRRTLAALIDEKVETAIRIDDRSAAQRGTWPAAAIAALRGDPDAARVVIEQVAPHVAAQIAPHWVPAMESATAAIASAYHRAATALAELPGAVFTLAAGPQITVSPSAGAPPPPAAPAVAPGVPSAVAPASDTGWWDGAAPGPAPIPAAVPSARPGPPGRPGPLTRDSAPMPEPAAGRDPSPLKRKDPETQQTEEADADPDTGPDADPYADPDAAPEVEAVAQPPGPDEVRGPQNAPGSPAAPPPPEPQPLPLLAAELPPPVPFVPVPAAADPGPRTPCEIAADELPQVGQ